MSGHSHFRTIKHKKEITDKKRGQIFSKLSRMISIAAREKGGDPETNPKLRLSIERAKEFNIPKENIERAIKRGTGELKGAVLEEVLFEAYGPSKIAIIIEGITDNKNRTLSEIKQILNQHNGKLVSPGAVKWMFERKGCVTVDSKLQIEDLKDKGKLELLAIEAGAEDIYWHDAAHEGEPRQGRDLLDVYTKPEELEKIKKILENKGIKTESASLDWVAKEELEIEEKDKIACQKLFAALDDNEAVQEIYSNLKV
ncbi:YebC/PmpR family DNA-binding transcriptional regulator [Patescibacteria group bacterium]|nr:YebC/PmpR family DNA-binding transcriptional regulator [Patescibacteria group bacterium]